MSKLLRFKNPETEIQSMIEQARERVESQYDPKIVDYILSVERAWDRFALTRDMDELYRLLLPVVTTKAQIYGRKWRRWRLSVNDFLSLFWETAWNVIEEYSWVGKSYLSEKIYRALDNVAMDLIRQATKVKRNIPIYQTLSLEEESKKKDYPDDRINIEEQVLSRIHTEQIQPLLDQRERQLLPVLLDNPSGSLRELGELAGINHPQTVQRTLRSLAERILNVS